MKFPLQLSLAALTISACVGGLFALGQQTRTPQVHTSTQKTTESLRTSDQAQQPDSKPLTLANNAGLALAEALLPEKSWAKLSLLGNLTGTTPFGSENFPQLSAKTALRCQSQEAPPYLALGILPTLSPSQVGGNLDSIIKRLVAVAPTASKNFFNCATAQIKAHGGELFRLPQGQGVKGPAGTLFLHDNGSLAFVRSAAHLSEVINRLDSLSSLATEARRKKRLQTNLSLQLYIKPQAGWLASTGTMAEASPLSQLHSIRLRLTSDDELTAEFTSSLKSADKLHEFLQRSLEDLTGSGDKNKAAAAQSMQLMALTLRSLPPGVRQKLLSMLQSAKVEAPKVNKAQSEGLILVSFDLKQAGLKNFLQNAFGSAPQP